MKKIIWKLEQRKLEELIPYEFNPRNITEKGKAELKKSIDKFGLAEPIVINLDNTIIGGHARYLVLLEKKEKFCDCYVCSFLLTSKEMKELNVRLNKNIAGEWDFNISANSFELPDLLEWGFEKSELKMLNDSKNQKNIELQNLFEVIIECENELDQEQTFNKIKGLGLKCRLLTL